MDAYERSLKQQADRIRRELSQEGKKGAQIPKPEPKDEFIPSDVPSPIYGYARPKPKVNEHTLEASEDLSLKQAMRIAESMRKPEDNRLEKAPSDEVDESEVETLGTKIDTLSDGDNEVETISVEQTERTLAHQNESQIEEQVISPETSGNPETRANERDDSHTNDSLGELSIVDNSFASIFMSSTDLNSSKLVVQDEKQGVTSQEILTEPSVEDVAPIVEGVAKVLQSDEQNDTSGEETLTPAVTVSYKAEGPPLNVMMTPQDRMAMYKSRRLAKKNNNL